MSYEEEDTCVSYEEEDTCVSYEEEDTCVSYEEEGTCVNKRGLHLASDKNVQKSVLNPKTYFTYP